MPNLQPPVWYDIVPDKLKCRCFYCKKQGHTDEFVYIERKNGLTGVIVHKKCMPPGWFSRREKGFPPKQRTVAKEWHAKGWPPKIKLIHKRKKIDYSIPKEFRKPKPHKH